MQHGRDDARRAVGRRRHDAAARGVLFIDRHGVQVDPVHHGQRVGQRALGALRQVAVQLGRAPAHPQRAGQFAVGFRIVDAAAARHAVLHDLPDAVQAAAGLRGLAPGQLVLHHQLGHRQPAFAAHGQQFPARAERVRQLVVRGDDLAVRGARRHHEAATDRQVTRFAQRLAVGVDSVEFHAVGVLGHGFAPVEHHVLFFDERNRVAAKQRQLAAGAHRGDHAFNGGRVHRVGRLAHQPQQHALVGAVPLARGAQRTVEFGAHMRNPGNQAVAFQALREQQGGPHRPHRMGTRRAYANLEQIKYGNGHATHSNTSTNSQAMIRAGNTARRKPGQRMLYRCRGFRHPGRHAIITKLLLVIKRTGTPLDVWSYHPA
ncbi:hypothetical protein D3C72_1044630 [compost metagenome]